MEDPPTGHQQDAPAQAVERPSLEQKTSQPDTHGGHRRLDRPERQNQPSGAKGDVLTESASQEKPTPGPVGDKHDGFEKQDSKSPKNGSRRRRSRGSSGGGKPSMASHAHDPDQVANHAWKIYLAEITEEGVTMVNDQAAKDLARRCFELAVTFMDEKERQRG